MERVLGSGRVGAGLVGLVLALQWASLGECVLGLRQVRLWG